MAKHIEGRLYYEAVGTSGLPMLFLHSTPDDLRFWMFQTAYFSPWFRTVAVDLGGYGRSPAVTKGVRTADHAEACWDVLDELHYDEVIIQGNSMGSVVAIDMAKQQPSRVKALILSGAGYLKDRSMMRVMAARHAAGGISVRHQQIFEHFAVGTRQSPILKHYADMVVSLNNEHTVSSIVANNEGLADCPEGDAFYDGISAPVCIIAGTEDQAYPRAFELQKRLKGSELFVMGGAGHAANIEMPAEFNAHCVRFLSKLGFFPGPKSELHG